MTLTFLLFTSMGCVRRFVLKKPAGLCWREVMWGERPRVEGFEELGKLIPDGAVRDAYSRNLETTVDKVLDYSREGLAGLITTVRETYNDLLRRSAGRRGRRVLYLLGVAALVTADYLAAEEVRGPSTSRFLRAVKVFSEAYFSKPT